MCRSSHIFWKRPSLEQNLEVYNFLAYDKVILNNKSNRLLLSQMIKQGSA